MGAWDAGNFDNDTAMDFVHDIVSEIQKELKAPECVEDVDLVMAGVAMLSALVSECSAYADRDALVTLRQSILSIYDEEIDGLQPTPEYKLQRRVAIEDTFNTLLTRLDR